MSIESQYYVQGYRYRLDCGHEISAPPNSIPKVGDEIPCEICAEKKAEAVKAALLDQVEKSLAHLRQATNDRGSSIWQYLMARKAELEGK